VMERRSLVNQSPHPILYRTSRAQRVPTIVRGEGVHVYDSDGKRYLDFVAGWTRPVHIGYGRKEVAQAVYDQICELAYISPCGFENPRAIELSKILASLAPKPIEQFCFVCDGSEAVEAALKLAKQYHYYRGDKQRHRVIARQGAYHGTTSGALRLMGMVPAMRHVMEPLANDGVFVDSPYCYRCPLGLMYPDCDLACARRIERVIEFGGPEYFSAFIGEPIQQGFGTLVPPAGYWDIIRNICDRYGLMLIVDEVICGFGRTGAWFACEHFGLRPDLITMAKGLTSGYVPLGAAGCTEAVAAPIDTFQHMHTYGNHPVSCAAAIANLQIIRDEGPTRRPRRPSQQAALRTWSPELWLRG
jgi:adenosylmethionine-8-amino-7-oxononanoate aminotransferase